MQIDTVHSIRKSQREHGVSSLRQCRFKPDMITGWNLKMPELAR